MRSVKSLLQRLSFLDALWKKLAKPIKAVAGVPPVIKLAVLALVVLAFAAYIFFDSGRSWRDVGIFLAIVALVGLGLWGVERVIRSRQRKMDSAFTREFAGTEMVEELRTQWLRAVAELGTTGIDRYNMSFYMLIGEPQSGKTTTLTKSGLNFPIGMNKIQGIGGTRNLDWWFTDEAVILDTAGRLTFQDRETTDEAEWQEFLQLVKRYRPKCPVNGVIVTIPCTSLLQDDPEVREQKAQVLRKALVEIERNLEVQFPVYVLVTKADRIGGFAEFFAPLRAMEQTQLLGWSRPRSMFGKPFSGDEVRAAFRGIVHRMRRFRILLLDQGAEEMSAEDRDRLYPFPEELALLEQPLVGYLETIFPDSRLLDPLYFRGFFITSGVQRGVPVLEACARVLGGGAFGERIMERASLNAEKAYFIRDFYRKKVFLERGLIVPTKSRVRRVLVIKRIGYSVAAAAALLGTLWIGFRFKRITAEVEVPAKAFSDLETALKQPPDARGVGNVLKALDELAGQAQGRPNARGVTGQPLLDVFEGRVGRGGGLFSIAGAREKELVRDIARAYRYGFNQGVLAPRIKDIVNGLAELGTAPPSDETALALHERIKRRLAGLEECTAMIVEDSRAKQSTGSRRSAPQSLDNTLGLAFDGAVVGDSRSAERTEFERARRVYQVLTRIVDHTDVGWGAYDEDKRGLGGQGLSYGWTTALTGQGQRLAGVLNGTREDILKALQNPDPTCWIHPGLLPAAGTDGNATHDELRGDIDPTSDPDRAARTVGYLLLRAAWLEKRASEDFVSVETLMASLQGQELAAFKSQHDQWETLFGRLTADLAELQGIARLLEECQVGRDTALAALVAPFNGDVDRLREVGSALGHPHTERFDEYWDLLGEQAPWIDLSKGDIEVVRWMREALSTNSQRTKFDLVVHRGPTPEKPGALEALPALAALERQLELTDQAFDDLVADRPWLSGIDPGTDLQARDVANRWSKVDASPLHEVVADKVNAWQPPSGLNSGAPKVLAEAAGALRRHLVTLGLRRELLRVVALMRTSPLLENLPPVTELTPHNASIRSLSFDQRFIGSRLGEAVSLANALVSDAQKASVLTTSQSTADLETFLLATDRWLVDLLNDWMTYWDKTEGGGLLDRVRDSVNSKTLEGLRTSALKELVNGFDGDVDLDVLKAYRQHRFALLLPDGNEPSIPTLSKALPESNNQLEHIRRALRALHTRKGVEHFDNILRDLCELLRKPEYAFVLGKDAADAVEPDWRNTLLDPDWRKARDATFAYFENLPRGTSNHDASPINLLQLDEAVQCIASKYETLVAQQITELMRREYERLRKALEHLRLTARAADFTSIGAVAWNDAEEVLGREGSLKLFWELYADELDMIEDFDWDGRSRRASGSTPRPFLGAERLPNDRAQALSQVRELATYFRWFVHRPDSEVRVEVGLDPTKCDPGLVGKLQRVTVATSTDSSNWHDSNVAQHFYVDRTQNPASLLLNRLNPALHLQLSYLKGTQFAPDLQCSILRSQRVRTDADAGGVLPIAPETTALSYFGWSALFEAIQELGGASGSTIEPRYSDRAGKKRSVFNLPVRVRYRGADTGQQVEGSVILELTLEGVHLPTLPIALPAWIMPN